MARKTDGTTTTRKQKTNPATDAAAVQPVSVQATPEVRSAEVRTPEVRTPEVRTPEVRNEARSEVRSNVTPINVAPVKPAAKKPQAAVDNVKLDEEIRRRAYELFLQRNGAPGDPSADWIVAEREVRARFVGKDSAFAAGQGS